MQTDKTIKSVYIHIPFCKNICSYCDFCKNYYSENIAGNYLDSLKCEINDIYKNEILDTLYIGGGTPSCLSNKNLRKLFEIINIFKLSKTYEFTFECNYEDINEEMLQYLKNNRVNRISIGLQTFNDKFSGILQRNINKKEMIKKIELSKKYFDNINLDFMYGFNNETIDDIKSDLDDFIKLKVSHISTYSLIVCDNTKLIINGYKSINEDIESDMYKIIVNTLKDNGYNHYELSNFSKKGFESKHNITYWNNSNYYGFGAGASGFIGDVRYDNTKSVFNYINKKRVMYKEIISKEQMLKDEVMLSLRLTTGINKNKFFDKYHLDLKKVFDIKEIIASGFLAEDKSNIFIPSKYLFVSNEIILKILDKYLLN